jgi:hypothetical protein
LFIVILINNIHHVFKDKLMATIDVTVNRIFPNETSRVSYAEICTWELDTGDVGAAIKAGKKSWDISVQITGTFDSSTATIEGSNDNVTWTVLNTLVGSAASVTADSFIGILERPVYIRPNLSSEDPASAGDVKFSMSIREDM